jgi:hypothetical protein
MCHARGEAIAAVALANEEAMRTHKDVIAGLDKLHLSMNTWMSIQHFKVKPVAVQPSQSWRAQRGHP